MSAQIDSSWSQAPPSASPPEPFLPEQQLVVAALVPAGPAQTSGADSDSRRGPPGCWGGGQTAAPALLSLEGDGEGEGSLCLVQAGSTKSTEMARTVEATPHAMRSLACNRASPFNLFFLLWMFASQFMPTPRLCQPKAA